MPPNVQEEGEGELVGGDPILEDSPVVRPSFDRELWFKVTGGASKGRILGMGTNIRPSDFILTGCSSTGSASHGGAGSDHLSVAPDYMQVEERQKELEERIQSQADEIKKIREQQAQERREMAEQQAQERREMAEQFKRDTERLMLEMSEQFRREMAEQLMSGYRPPHPPPASD